MNLSIKNVPEDFVECMRQRATRDHRAPQGELMTIIEAAATALRRNQSQYVYSEITKLGLSAPNESMAMIRRDHDRN